MSGPRCKPGDLAVVVSAPATPELIGRFVVVDRSAKVGEWIGGCTWDLNPAYGHAWVIKSAAGGTLQYRTRSGVTVQADERVLVDSCLRPIRPNEGEDESLSWARPRVDELATSGGCDEI